MLKRYEKRRYVAMLPDDRNPNQDFLFKKIKKFATELFGTISIEQAFLKIINIKSDKNILVIKCNLEKLEMLLLTIALIHPPIVILGVHGSIKKLERAINSANIF